MCPSVVVQNIPEVLITPTLRCEKKRKWKSGAPLNYRKDLSRYLDADTIYNNTSGVFFDRGIYYVTRSHKRGLKSLGPMRAAGKEARDNHYTRSFTRFMSHFNRPQFLRLLRHKLDSNVAINCIVCTQFLLYWYLNCDPIDLRLLSWERVT